LKKILKEEDIIERNNIRRVRYYKKKRKFIRRNYKKILQEEYIIGKNNIRRKE